MPRRYYKKAENPLSWDLSQVLPFTVLALSWHLGNSLPIDALSLYSGIYSPTFAVSSYSFYPFCSKQPLQEVFRTKRPSYPEGCGKGGNKWKGETKVEREGHQFIELARGLAHWEVSNLIPSIYSWANLWTKDSHRLQNDVTPELERIAWSVDQWAWMDQVFCILMRIYIL